MSTQLKVFLFCAVVIGLAFPGQTSAMTIDFEDLGVAVGTQLNPPINATTTSSGFDFTSPDADLHFHNENGFGNNGSTHLGAHAFVDFAPSGGGVFSLSQFDFEYFLNDLGSITAIGNLFGGGTVNQVFATDGIPNLSGGVSTYETFVLNSSFVNLVSARITSGLPNSISVTGFFVDNIVTDLAAVPEPSSLLLLGSGLAGLGLWGWWRRKDMQA